MYYHFDNKFVVFAIQVELSDVIVCIINVMELSVIAATPMVTATLSVRQLESVHSTVGEE